MSEKTVLFSVSENEDVATVMDSLMAYAKAARASLVDQNEQIKWLREELSKTQSVGYASADIHNLQSKVDSLEQQIDAYRTQAQKSAETARALTAEVERLRKELAARDEQVAASPEIAHPEVPTVEPPHIEITKNGRRIVVRIIGMVGARMKVESVESAGSGPTFIGTITPFDVVAEDRDRVQAWYDNFMAQNYGSTK